MKQRILAFIPAAIALLLLLASQSRAQPRIVERSFTMSDKQTVELDLKFGQSIIVKGWDKKEVSFRAVIEINNGRLNDALILDFREEENIMAISSDFDNKMLNQGRRTDCPGYEYPTFTWSNDDNRAVCSDIAYEIYVPRDIDLRIESISSDIELSGLQGPIRAKSISGFVDLSWPVNRGAEISMKTVSGEVYSGIDQLSLQNRKGGAPLVGYEIRASVGSGGPWINLESVSGNIYIRKGG